MGKVKVKCIGSLDNKYFVGMDYEIDEKTLEQNQSCFEKIEAKPEENKIMKQSDIKTK